MPVTVSNPYTGKDDETCSVSFAAQQGVAAGVSSPQTEAQYNRSKLAGEWGVIQAKAAQGQISNGTKVLTFEQASTGITGYVYLKGGKLNQVIHTGGKRFDNPLLHPKDVDYYIKSKGYKVAIPQAVAPSPKVVTEPTLVDKAWFLEQKSKAQSGFTLAATEDGSQRIIFVAGNFHLMERQPNGSFSSLYSTQSANLIAAQVSGQPKSFYRTDHKGVIGLTKTSPAEGAQVAAPVPSTPVNSGSTSVGSMSDEDVAAMFVKIKDDLAKEKGLNIKGANAELDTLVHKEIGKKTGYTADEVKGKIDAYKAAGNKLSALKKKVLLGTKKVPDPKPNAVPTKATATIVNEVKETVAEVVDTQPKKHYSDEDIAAAYIIAKDKVVAESNGKWTLYTKSDELDLEIAIQVGLKTGFNPLQQKQAIANYLGSGKKLSTLKKQLAKQGAFTPQADTMKKSGADKDLADKAKDVEAKADAGYTPTPPPSSAGPKADGAKPKPSDFPTHPQYAKAHAEWVASKNKPGSPVESTKEAPKRVQKEDMQRGDISIFTDVLKTDVYKEFKAFGNKSYLTSSEGQIYEAIAGVQLELKNFNKDLSLLQILRIVDEQGAKKFGVENTKVFEKKVATWLTTPAGEAHIKHAQILIAEEANKKKLKAEAEKLAKELEANQPPLPADSARFDVLPAQAALDLNNRMQKEQAWTPAQVTALKYYTSNAGYTAMNGANRRGTGSTATVKKIKDAQAGMRPSDVDALLHRGCDLRQVGLQGNPEAIWGLTGKLLKDDGFMSTSYGGRAAFGGELLIEFQAPKGTMMTVVKSISHYSNENEILLAAGTQYRVLRVEKREPHGWKLIVRVEGVDFVPAKVS